MADLAAAGIVMKEVTDKLAVDGVQQFADAFDLLLEATASAPRASCDAEVTGKRTALPQELNAKVKANAGRMAGSRKVSRLCATMLRCGRARMKRSGSAGSILWTTSYRTSNISRTSPRR